jgi:acetylornithine deacetylase/succinyl-diaminopimelate desuccinylase-like protein
MAHSDTVPVFLPEEWTVDPFAGTIKDGRIYGLGVSDDKWGLSAMVTLVKSLKEQYGDIPKRLIFASTIDEEHGVGNGLLLLMLKGIKGEAALYLDGAQMDICIGNLGGSILYLRPKQTFSEEGFDSHFEKIKEMCLEESKKRSVKFDGLDYFSENWSRNSTLVVHKRKDENGRFMMIGFYTLPGEDKDLFYEALTKLVSDKLGDDINRYDISCREPWFEPALSPGDAPLIGYMAEAVRDVTGERGKITTISKQDAFVFINHANIPVVSFGVGTTEGRGAFHNPDECLVIDKAWQGCQVIHRAVSYWLEKKA